MTSEVRVVNPETGGEKCSKDLQMSYIPIAELQEVLRLYHAGATKYSKGNWMRGYDWSLSYDALQRHAMQFWSGESKDDETGCSHLASVIFHAFALMYFEANHPKLDDRPAPFTGSNKHEPEPVAALRDFLIDQESSLYESQHGTSKRMEL